MSRTSKAAGSVAFVTGANRGIGLGFVAGCNGELCHTLIRFV